VNIEVSDEEAKHAQMAHEVFLFNLIFNHVFLFIATVSAPSLQVLTLIVPTLSLLLMGFTIWYARRAATRESAYVSCHWRLAARRTFVFGGMWLVCGAGILLLLLVAGGHLRPHHYAFGALMFFPIMGTMLTLIILESEALQHARHRTLPQKAAERCRVRQALGLAA
jgi:hypothetical protein